MKFKRYSLGILLFGILMVLSGSVFGYDGITGYTWVVGDPNYNAAATIHLGTIDITNLVMGDFLGISSAQPNAPGFGDSGAVVGWDDNWVMPVGNGNTNGDNLDGLWVQLCHPATGWWDLGSKTNRVVVFTSQDHGPYLKEGLEYRVFGSNALWDGVSTQAVLTDVYLDGWRPHNSAEDINTNGWCSDDIAAVYVLPGYYRYAVIEAWTSESPLNQPEVDAVATPPPPVGGFWVPINKTELSAPWIGLASLITVASASAVFVKHRKKKQT